MELNQEFLIETFFSYCKRPLHKKYQNAFNAECPVCKEGKSSGRTRRLFYFPNKQYLYCHNCSKAWLPFEWVKEVTSLSIPEILKRNREKTGDTLTFESKSKQVSDKIVATTLITDLPEDNIDLTNLTQLDYYKDNEFVKLALQYCNTRRLWSAVNTCRKFYISLTDRIHKNRLIIPFFDDAGKIICYQTRALIANQTPKYLTKFGEKEIFGLQNIDASIPYIFVFEGPIDSMFVKNGVAMASLSPTQKQLQQLNNQIGYQLIYVLDNDKDNKQTSKKIEKYIREGKMIFIWPKELKQYKDFNEVCCKLKLNEISWSFVARNSKKGPEALIKQKLNRIP